MIQVTTRMAGWAELRDKIRRLPEAVQGPVLLRALRPEAQAIADEMAANCPREEPAPDMADSLGVVTLESSQYAARVAITNRPSHPHGWLIYLWEWGTSLMQGKPIMRPVWDARSGGAMERILQRLGKVLMGALKKSGPMARYQGADWR